jgi:hypothetical protein
MIFIGFILLYVILVRIKKRGEKKKKPHEEMLDEKEEEEEVPEEEVEGGESERGKEDKEVISEGDMVVEPGLESDKDMEVSTVDSTNERSIEL